MLVDSEKEESETSRQNGHTHANGVVLMKPVAKGAAGSDGLARITIRRYGRSSSIVSHEYEFPFSL